MTEATVRDEEVLPPFESQRYHHIDPAQPVAEDALPGRASRPRRRFLRVIGVLGVLGFLGYGLGGYISASETSKSIIADILKKNGLGNASLDGIKVPLWAGFSDFEGSALISFPNDERVIAAFSYTTVGDTAFASFAPAEWSNIIVVSQQTK
ncbi:hypothetical protein [Fuscibacter oryzae]|uniref:Uncharacterized protein n=1 Tax=Fuscibacter oryzae TaxID=2803939 RepID=A0A8J7MTJ1_9RHOB|nr:hypothetical protein [Fuscibacter oryzae]MBL4929362.1 hypothetical protein [Fuscibacter oryzae]